MSSVNFLAEYGLKKISKCGQVVAYTEIKKKKKTMEMVVCGWLWYFHQLKNLKNQLLWIHMFSEKKNLKNGQIFH